VKRYSLGLGHPCAYDQGHGRRYYLQHGLGGMLTTGWPPKPHEQTTMRVVNHEQTSLFLLIFSFAIYVRDAGVAGSNPATPTMKLLRFSSFFTIGSQVNPGNSSRTSTDMPRNPAAFHGSSVFPQTWSRACVNQPDAAQSKYLRVSAASFRIASSDPFFTGCKAPERRDRRPENPLCCA
jgi:hypothetical protein